MLGHCVDDHVSSPPSFYSKVFLVIPHVEKIGLLRQYFPKGTDLGIHSAEDLDWVAAELNDRPRKRLEFRKPIELIGSLLLQ